MNPISFMSANFVAREIGYHMPDGWMQGDNATNDTFRPIETYAERFDAMLVEVSAMGFKAIDIWGGHLHPSWATDEHIAIARDRLAAHGLTVTSLATFYGDSVETVEQVCRLAVALETTVIGGNMPLVETDRQAAADLLEIYGVRLGLENHPEKNAAEIMARVGEGGPIGACVDTGWFGTYGYSAPQALRELAPVLVHVHLKDVRGSGDHETCRFGEGVVDIAGCVTALQEIGYRGAISIEHEPDSYDPTEDVVASLAILQQWLGEESAS